MFNFLFHISNINLFFLISIFFLISSIIFSFILRRLVFSQLRYRDNAVVGTVSANIGVIYGVLVGLTALYLINTLNSTSGTVQREANAVSNIYRDSRWLQEPMRGEIQKEIKNYLTTVINVEWPIMQKGGTLDDKGERIIDKLSEQLYQFSLANKNEVLASRNLLDEIKALYNAREQRILVSYSSLSSEMWVVILIGTILTISITFLFKVTPRLHATIIGATALMAASMVFLLLTMDCPFQGEFVVTSDGFKSLLAFIEKEPS